MSWPTDTKQLPTITARKTSVQAVRVTMVIRNLDTCCGASRKTDRTFSALYGRPMSSTIGRAVFAVRVVVGALAELALV